MLQTFCQPNFVSMTAVLAAAVTCIILLFVPAYCQFDDPCVGAPLRNNNECHFYLDGIADYSYAYFVYEKKVVYAELIVDDPDDVYFIGNSWNRYSDADDDNVDDDDVDDDMMIMMMVDDADCKIMTYYRRNACYYDF
jgi:hypothetical protein